MPWIPAAQALLCRWALPLHASWLSGPTEATPSPCHASFSFASISSVEVLCGCQGQAWLGSCIHGHLHRAPSAHHSLNTHRCPCAGAISEPRSLLAPCILPPVPLLWKPSRSSCPSRDPGLQWVGTSVQSLRMQLGAKQQQQIFHGPNRTEEEMQVTGRPCTTTSMGSIFFRAASCGVLPWDQENPGLWKAASGLLHSTSCRGKFLLLLRPR